MFCAQCGTRVSASEPSCRLCGTLLPGHTADELARPAIAVVPEPVRYGGFWRRFTALLLDTFVLYFPAATIRVLLGLPAINSFSTIDVDSNASMIASALELFLDWLYVAFLVSSRSRATLGMIVMDLELTRTDGERVSFSRATWRYFAQFLSVITVGIGYVMQLFTARRQTLHDMVTSTVVVRAGRKVVPLGAPTARSLA